MPANRKPKRWNLKPQLTAAPELWEKCGLFLSLSGSKTEKNLVGPETINGNVTGTNVGVISNRGVSWQHTGSTNEAELSSNQNIPTGNNLTWAFLLVTTFNSDNLFRWIATTSVNNENGIRCLYAASGVSGSWRFRNASTATNTDVTVAHSIGDLVLFVGRLGKDNQLKLAVYNLTTGVISENSSASGPVSSHENNLRLFYVGASAGSFDEGVPGNYLWFSVWDRAISDSEIFKLSQEPFAMLRPAGF